jgi:streptomycin 6-kinase
VDATQVRLPDSVLSTIVPDEPERAGAWIAALPGIVVELAARWSLTVGAPYEGGCTAFVAPAERPDGSSVVLKVLYPHWEARYEAEALEAWDGDGAVRLLDREPDWSAMLLERLEPGTPLSAHPDQDAAVGIACALLRRLWRPPPPDSPFDLVTDVAKRWSSQLPERFERLDRPFDGGLVRAAVDLCEAFARSSEPLVIANHDFHLDNVLAARREPWLMIDPKPIAGERAFDTGHFVRSLSGDEPGAPNVEASIRRLATELDLDPERIRAWAFVRAVENAVWTCGRWDPDGGARDVAFAALVAP